MEQTIPAGTVAAIIVNTVDSSGAHVVASIDDTTTRLQKGDSGDTTWDNAVPTISTIATGVYLIKWVGLSPAITVEHNDDRLRAKINGTIGGVAWTEYHLPLRVEVSNESLSNLQESAKQIIRGTATGDYTTTTFSASGLASTADNHWIGRLLIFTSGVLAGQEATITGYVDSPSRTFTFTAVTTAPSGNTFIIV